MSITTDLHFSRTSSFASRLSNMLARLSETQEKRAVYRKTLRELKSLSPRALNDLGLSRASIHSTAFEAAYGK